MRLLISILLLAFSNGLFSQQVVGYVYEEHDGQQHAEAEHLLLNANVYWNGTTIGTLTDVDGFFELSGAGINLPAELAVSYLGYNKTIITITEWPEKSIQVFLSPMQLDGIEVVDYVSSTNLSTVDPFGVENLSSDELGKAACCNLSESFETNASVDVVMQDAVSGSKKIQMLGLDGYYTQLTFENIPIIRGLSASHGLNTVPGTWIESIQVSKGAGSVINGYESITGQINLEYIKPDETDKLYINAYGNNNGRVELNTHWATKLNDKWSQMWFAHGSTFLLKNDHNNDGFLDMPTGHNINVMNRWKNVRENGMSQFGIRFMDSHRHGGEVAYDHSDRFAAPAIYGIDMQTRQYELFGKNGIILDRPETSIGLIGAMRRHEQNYMFGLKGYSGIQDYGYFNAIYQTYVGNTQHTFKTGASMVYDKYDEVYNDSAYNREEIVPGAFAEYTYNNGEYFSVVAGVRGDYHNIYGAIFNPRLHLKWNPKELMALRFSVGRGFRVANVIPENGSILASSRKLVITEPIEPEIAWNFGSIFTWKFEIGERKEGYFNLDYFYTLFENQAVADLDLNSQQVVVSNLVGESYSHSFQVEIGAEVVERLWLKAAYKHYDVRTTYHGELLEKPLVARDRALFNIGYQTMSEIWKFDLTANWFGQKRLPSTIANPTQYQMPNYSNPYFTLNAQVTKEFRHVEIYIGGENLLNFKQNNAIISADNPFGQYFDASMIWGPVNGRVIYGGLRFKIK